PAAEVSLSDLIRDMDSGPAPPPPPPPTEVQPAAEVSLSDLIRDMDSGPAPAPPPPPTEVQPAAANEVQQPAPLCIQLVLPNSVTGIQFSSAIHASAHDDTLQVRRFTPASRDLEPFHFLSSTKFAVLQAVEMRFDSSENNSIRAQLKFNIRMRCDEVLPSTNNLQQMDEIDLSGIALPVAISDLDVIEENNPKSVSQFLAGKMMRPMSFASLFLGFVPLARLFLYSCFATPAPMMLMMMVVVMRIVGLDTGVQFRTWTGS
uniref:PITH domain-containing protein n=1 Tax=Macrostomum lignano TaxID=282301 RepID=A0A1I8FSG3_9PLAT